uniref:Pentraxin (PTX) domain-containing protein n=1 Tax=Podarcis muralis TaxID=64176 RepID=A0A670K2E2_PODMU
MALHWALLCLIFSPLMPATEYGLPKFICSPMPLDMDNGCQSARTLEEAKETILHLRETVVHQKETILDQRETVRELTAKLSRCEAHSRRHVGEHHGGHHEENHSHGHGHHEGVHRGHHEGGHRTHHEDGHRGHHENHNRNSSVFSTSLRDALQKKISILEHQIHEKSNTSEHHMVGVPTAAGLRHKHVSHGHSSHISDPLCPPGNKVEKQSEDFRVGFPLRTNYMYVKVKRTLHHEIFAFSICLWLKSSSAPGMGTPFSYSVPGQANEVVLIEWGNNPMELLINDKAATLPLAINDAKWHHICVTWSTRDGIWESYQDGVRRGSGENLAPWHPVKPGGVFVLGQEQDTLGGRFDATQAFIGEISDFNMWGHILTPGEVYKMATCTSYAGGDIINWAEASMELHGGVVKLPFNACH